MRKKLLLIATGGTIASRPAEDGLTPEMTSEELLQCIPEVRSLCEIDTVQPFNLDSTNMRPQNWVELVKIIRDKYESYDGFVITHGTALLSHPEQPEARRADRLAGFHLRARYRRAGKSAQCDHLCRR